MDSNQSLLRSHKYGNTLWTRPLRAYVPCCMPRMALESDRDWRLREGNGADQATHDSHSKISGSERTSACTKTQGSKKKKLLEFGSQETYKFFGGVLVSDTWRGPCRWSPTSKVGDHDVHCHLIATHSSQLHWWKLCLSWSINFHKDLAICFEDPKCGRFGGQTWKQTSTITDPRRMV